jgi:rare lipoprotein A
VRRAAGVALAVLAAVSACAPRREEPADGGPGGAQGPPARAVEAEARVASPSSPAPAPAPAPARAERAEVGLASFYSRRFAGRRTASGERYDARALTCAHRTAPFGTRLRVTELESGRSVVVTVNDRGPAGRRRVVDVSLAAARALGIVGRGVARVRVERVAE